MQKWYADHGHLAVREAGLPNVIGAVARKDKMIEDWTKKRPGCAAGPRMT